MERDMRILVTGGAGFIGSHFTRTLLRRYDYEVVVLDKLTYAGNLNNLLDLKENPNFSFVKGDICDRETCERLIKESDLVVNFAAETHVDRSILDAGSFVQTDIFGTYRLLEACRRYEVERYVQISTDEVYGSIMEGAFREEDLLRPSSPYSASKAGGDLLVQSYHMTYGLPALIIRSSNNFGPNQYPEKLIPLFIVNALRDILLPLYGDGLNVRDWIYVLDNCEAIDLLLWKGKAGETYNVGGGNERTNLEITRLILQYLGKPEDLISFIKDRPGHDRRYALDSTKIRALGWRPRHSFEAALRETVAWYRENEWWWRPLVR
jgi:dTDP-glucose 4,6-dehydratase